MMSKTRRKADIHEKEIRDNYRGDLAKQLNFDESEFMDMTTRDQVESSKELEEMLDTVNKFNSEIKTIEDKYGTRSFLL